MAGFSSEDHFPAAQVNAKRRLYVICEYERMGKCDHCRGQTRADKLPVAPGEIPVKSVYASKPQDAGGT